MLCSVTVQHDIVVQHDSAICRGGGCKGAGRTSAVWRVVLLLQVGLSAQDGREEWPIARAVSIILLTPPLHPH